MLRLVDNGTPDDLAYRVPFAVDRTRAPWYELHNRGAERVRGVSLSMLGSGRLLWGLPTALDPGGYLRFGKAVGLGELDRLMRSGVPSEGNL